MTNIPKHISIRRGGRKMEGDNSKKTLKAAAYCRVSTLLNQSIENQSVPIAEYCRNRGFSLVAQFADEGISGKRERRPALDQMLKDARSGKFQVLIVSGLDRLGRDLRHLLTMLDALNSYGVQFVSLRESVDLTQPTGRLIMSVIGAIAEFERELIRTRIKEALAAKKMIAIQTGSSWRCGRKNKVNDEISKKVIALRNQGLSIREGLIRK